MNPRSRQIYSLRDRAEEHYGIMGPLARVAEWLRGYVAVVPGDPLAWVEYGDSLRQTGRFREAEQAFLRAGQLLGSGQRALVDAHLGILEAHRGSPQRAEEWFREAAAANDCPDWVWFMRGVNLRTLESLPQAIDCLNTALGLEDVNREEVLLNLALAAIHGAEYERAEALLQQALLIDRDYPSAKIVLASLAGAKEAHDEARGSTLDAQSLWDRAAKAREESGPSPQVAEWLRAYVALESGAAVAWIFYGDSLTEMGRFQDAQRALLTARNLSPEESRFGAEASLGTLATKWGRLEPAEECFSRATAAKACPALVWCRRGKNLLTLESIPLAQDCLSTALAMPDADRAEALSGLASAAAYLREYEKAAELAQQALQSNPQCYEAQALLVLLEGAQEARDEVQALFEGK